MAETASIVVEDAATTMASVIDPHTPVEHALMASAKAKEEAATALARLTNIQNTNAVAKHLRETSAATANPLPRSVPAP